MASSRIFVKGIPPTISETDFQRHFSARHSTTDVRIFPSRRIGYVGYKSPEDAAAAVKYFNKTFMKMSRLNVELARPVSATLPKQDHSIPNAGVTTHQHAHTPANEATDTSRKRKRGQHEVKPANAKLEEYLNITKARSNAKSIEDVQRKAAMSMSDQLARDESTMAIVETNDEDENEYQALANPKKPKKVEIEQAESQKVTETPEIDSGLEHLPGGNSLKSNSTEQAVDTVGADEDTGVDRVGTTDADWLRSRTSRLLGLLDEDEEEEEQARVEAPKDVMETSNEDDPIDGTNQTAPATDDTELETPDPPQKQSNLDWHDENGSTSEPEVSTEEAAIGKSGRLFLRNLPYNIVEDELRDNFSQHGTLDEVHVPMDNRTGQTKGVAYLQYADAASALAAYRAHDGQIFQGRLLHILPAASKRGSKLDEFEIAKLPLKKQGQIRKKLEAAKASFSWNSLYMNADAVMSSVSDRLGVDKAALLDPTSADAAVKQALAETHVINDTKTYFADNGVDLEAFKRSAKGDTAILVKNFTYGTKADDLKRMFEEHGTVVRMLMPPSGTIAIVEFATAPQARAAFASLAYRKVKDSVLFLERAPKDLFKTAAVATGNVGRTAVAAPAKSNDLLQGSEEVSSIDTATLFVRNLNFTTTSKRLAESFKALDGFLAARVKTKTDPRKPGELLSMGFGFLEFRSTQQAQAALAAMDGHTLDGHQLVIKASQKNMDAGEERRKKDKADRRQAQKAKVVIKNLPFETSKKDIRTLLRQYGQLRTVRMPKKFDNSARGFAFAEFTTPQEAANAIEALRNTHLLGRKMVMDYAEEDPTDAEAEIEKIAQKVADKTEKVSLQKLIGGGRRKFDVEQGEADEQD